jgi:uncharacterized protein involved in outer membrane biogenesis
MNNFLLWIGGLLVVLLCALFAVPHFIDWNGYRGTFEEEASRILGREVRVAGRVELRILPTPFVRFEKVRLSDVEGVTGEPFFRADNFTLWLAPGALLRGALEANRLELQRPILKLRLNAAGGGNWQTFSLNKGAMPFALNDAALHAVSLTDGAISVDAADGTELVRVDSIGGEVTASALTGPFRFRGQANWNGEARALRIATAAPEADGATRFKLNVSVPTSGNTYVLDGRIADWQTKPKLDGALTGSLQIVEGLRSGARRTSSGKPAMVPVDLKAQITGDADGFKLTELALGLDQDSAKPQQLTGTIIARWQGDGGVAANLTSRWLDIDRLLSPAAAGPQPRQDTLAPLTVLQQISTGLAGLMPATLPAKVAITADAVTLAGDTVNNVRISLERSGDQLQLREFRAGFPGSTRVEASGIFPTTADPAAFDGDVVVRGANLGRFLNWAGIASSQSEARNDSAFSLRSRLFTTAQSVAFRDINADFAGTVIGGSFQDDWSKRRRIDVRLEGSTIDLSNLMPGSLDFRAWRGMLQKSKAEVIVAKPLSPPQSPPPSSTGSSAGAGAGAATTAATSSAAGSPTAPPAAALPTLLKRWLDPAEGDLSVQVRAGRLIDGSQDLRDVVLTAALKDGRLALTNLHFQSAAGQTSTGQPGSGLDVDAEGEVGDLNGQPTGIMRGGVVAQDGAAVTQLMTLLGLTGADIGGTDQSGLLAPSRIAWTARFGNTGSAAGATASPTVPGRLSATIPSAPGTTVNAPSTAMDLTLDGAVLGRRLMVVLRLDGGLDDWRRSPLDATVTLDGPDFPRLVRLLKLDEFALGPIAAVDGRPADTKSADGKSGDVKSAGKLDQYGFGRLSAKIVGRSASDILVDVRFNDDGVDWSFAGRASAPPGGQLTADGEVRITAADLERAVAQAGLGRNASLANVVVDGSIDLFVKDGALRLASRGLTLNGNALLGDATLSLGNRRRLDARLSISEASIPRLLELLLDPRGQKKSTTIDDIIWSKVPFDLGRIANLDGNFRLEAKQMLLTKGLGLENAVLDAKLEKGRIDVTALDGKAAGGRLTSKWTLAPAATGAMAVGSLTLTGADLRVGEPPKAGVSAGQDPGLGLATKPAGPGAAPNAAPNGAGTADLTLTLSGQGLSPATVVAGLSGNGSIHLTDGRIGSYTPANVKGVIEAAMAGKIDLTADALERAMQKAGAASRLHLGTRKLEIALVDGAVRLAPMIVSTTEGQATNRTTIDLSNLKFDIEWRLDVNPPGAPAETGPPGAPSPANTTDPAANMPQHWPRVSVVHLGHLGETDLSVQRISVQALARELTVRKMERDVAELERLRRLDEERVRAETERLKAIDAAKDAQKAAEVPFDAGISAVPGAAPGSAAGQAAGSAAVPGSVPVGAPGGVALPATASGVIAADDAKRGAEQRRPQPAVSKTEQKPEPFKGPLPRD